MSKKLMLQMEKQDFELTRQSRPITSGGNTLKKGNEKAMAIRPLKRGLSIVSIKAEIARRKAAYRASSKKK